MNLTRLKIQLVKHESDKRKPYKDTEGHLTIGIGHNLEGAPLSDSATQLLFEEDIREAWHVCEHIYPGFNVLEEARQHALIDMAFNLGMRLAEFKKMNAAVDRREWETVAEEALNSQWARQVGSSTGQRAHTIARMLREGIV